MKSNLTVAMLSSILLTAAIAIPAMAAPQKLSKFTCEEFLRMDDVARPKLVYFSEGFNKKGKLDGELFEYETTDHYYPVLVEECGKTPKANLMKTIKKVKSGMGG